MNNWRNLIYPSRPDALLWRRGLLPTTALYFLNACADWIADGLVEQTGTNSFRTSRANLVIRQDLPEAVGQALDDRSRKLVYLVDDHVAAHASDVGLPENYRARLADRWQRVFQPLLRRASAIVVCSDYLLHHLLPYGPTLRTDPVWHRRLFEGLEQKLSAPALP